MIDLPAALRPLGRRRVRALLVALALVVSTTATAATTVRIAWIADRDDDSIFVASGLLAFHDGSLDFFDHDRPPTGLLQRSIPDLQVLRYYNLQESLRTDLAEAEFRVFISEPNPLVGAAITPEPPRYPRANQTVLQLNPGQHDYLSFVLPIQPSNDAFAGNEDAQRHRLFDDEGRFTGPFFIDIYGAEALDAGTCANDENNLAWLDRGLSGPLQDCAPGEGLVRAHPGLNGSARNPDGEPVRVLGNSSSFSPVIQYRFDPVAADFTRPGKRLGRLIVSSDTSWFGASGSWYSPERAGEGFSLQVLPPGEPGGPSRALVYWYTYAPDGSGRQLWLTGLGPIGVGIPGPRRPVVTIPVHSTSGGSFASTGNPQNVLAIPWGSLTLSFIDCDEALVEYQARDNDYGSGSFTVKRLGPPVEGLGWLCDPGDPNRPRPHPRHP